MYYCTSILPCTLICSSDYDYIQYDTIYYYAPWSRSGPYVVGLILGWFMYSLKGKKVKITWVRVLKVFYVTRL